MMNNGNESILTMLAPRALVPMATLALVGAHTYSSVVTPWRTTHDVFPVRYGVLVLFGSLAA